MTNLDKIVAEFPGKPQTLDGNTVVSYIESSVADAIFAYPITPSTAMSVIAQALIANGKLNVWGREVKFLESESEHSSMSMTNGLYLTGRRATNFSSSQGLILMKEVLYTTSGSRLPIVIHVGARALTTQSLNILAGHDDIMGVSDTGWGILFAKNAQEVADYTLIARKAAELSETPFMVVQDGFITTHTIENVLMPTDEMIVRYLNASPRNLIDFENPQAIGSIQNGLDYMTGKIAQRFFTDKIKGNLLTVMDEFTQLTGRTYGLVEKYKVDDANRVLVSLGSVSETAMAVVDHLRNKGEKVGVLNITSYRPFPAAEITDILMGKKAVAVIERLDNPLANDNPLTLEVKAALYGRNNVPRIYSGVGGLGGNDITAGDIIAAFANMDNEDGKRFFSLRINHESSLPVTSEPDLRPEKSFSLKGYSKGGQGANTTNKVIATALAGLYGLYMQSFSSYGAEKKGAPLNYYSTLSTERLRTHYQPKLHDFIAINDMQALDTQNPLEEITQGGVMFLQTKEKDYKKMWENLPDRVKKSAYDKNVQIVGIDAEGYAKEIAKKPEFEQRMQGILLLGVILKYSHFQNTYDKKTKEVFSKVEEMVRASFGKKGEDIVNQNMQLVKIGYDQGIDIPRHYIQQQMGPAK
ncbi:MAG: 2-oxoacid:acceptor oxidoreductase family protein [Candidatus Woesearchaeota archaeon]